MLAIIFKLCHSLFKRFKEKIKKFSRPTTTTIAAGFLSDLPRSKHDLILENAILRQQLIILNRSVKRPKLTSLDRVRLIFLARFTDFWPSALHIIQPETLLRWHRDLFRRYWKRKSKPASRKPRIPQETVDLILQMAIENPLWGAKMICGELLKLGIRVHKRPVQRHMRKVRQRTSGQNWATFLRNHAQDMWACDLTVVHTLFFKPIYKFVIIHQQTRLILHTAVTTSPTDDWTTQQMRDATPWEQRPKYLIRNNDNKYGHKFKAVLRSSGIKDINTPVRVPRANAICERFIGTLKRDCLDHFLILHEHQLRRVVVEFVAYYNDSRPHQGLDQFVPSRFYVPRLPPSNKPKGPIVSSTILHGLHRSYSYSRPTH